MAASPSPGVDPSSVAADQLKSIIERIVRPRIFVRLQLRREYCKLLDLAVAQQFAQSV